MGACVDVDFLTEAEVYEVERVVMRLPTEVADDDGGRGKFLVAPVD